MPREKKPSVAASLDRRQELRHAVERPCLVTSNDLVPEALDGVTMNISRAGVLIRFPKSDIVCSLPKVGANARVVIDLPPSSNYAPRSLECTGRVVRDAESSDDAPVLALHIERMQVRDRVLRPRTTTRSRKPLVH
jgi:hypothetical protein